MKRLLGFGALLAAVLIVAGCDEEPVDNKPEPQSAELRQAPGISAAKSASESTVQPPLTETDLPADRVREREPESKQDSPAGQATPGDATQTTTDDMGMNVDLVRAEIEDNELVVAVRYRNTMSMDHAVTLNADAISWRASGDLVQRPKADGLEPEGGEFSLGAGEEEDVRIRFPAPASQVEFVTIQINGARFVDIPIKRD